MPRLTDKPCNQPGIAPRQHSVRPSGGLKGQKTYPFKAMILGDYFCIFTEGDAIKVRSALRTFYRSAKYNGRHFTVRPAADGGEWICRRTA